MVPCVACPAVQSGLFSSCSCYWELESLDLQFFKQLWLFYVPLSMNTFSLKARSDTERRDLQPSQLFHFFHLKYILIFNLTEAKERLSLTIFGSIKNGNSCQCSTVMFLHLSNQINNSFIQLEPFCSFCFYSQSSLLLHLCPHFILLLPFLSFIL